LIIRRISSPDVRQVQVTVEQFPSSGDALAIGFTGIDGYSRL
jgi:hypothetical protein